MNNNFFKYLNIEKAEEDWGIYVTSVGYSKVEPHQEYPNQRHPDSHKLTWNRGRILSDYYIILVAKGKGIFDATNLTPTEITAGKCFLLFPDVWHRYKPDPQSGWEEYWLGFNGYYIKQLMKANHFSPESPVIDVNSNKEILVLFQKIIDSVTGANLGYHQEIAGITLQILGILNTVSKFKEYDNDPVGKLIAKAKFLLQKSFEGKVDMEEIARQLPMGYSAFRKAFKKVTGQSPNQYHINLRLNRAKDLLLSTNLNVSEISDQTGFESIYHFSKLFKKKTGVSPNAFRKLEPDFEV